MGLYGGLYRGGIIGPIKGDTRSLDNGLYRDVWGYSGGHGAGYAGIEGGTVLQL